MGRGKDTDQGRGPGTGTGERGRSGEGYREQFLSKQNTEISILVSSEPYNHAAELSFQRMMDARRRGGLSGLTSVKNKVASKRLPTD